MKAAPELIREIQLVNLNSLKRFDGICKKYGIVYWAAYGTLLGAVRHKGFIPWDDDLDLIMLREEYDKLCQVPAEEWGEDCCLCRPEDDDVRHDKCFPRVYQKRSHIQSYRDVKSWRDPGTGKSWSTSLMLDIYVFDHVPDDGAAWKAVYDRIFYIAEEKYKLSKLRYTTTSSSPVAKAKALARNAWGGLMRLRHKKPWRYYAALCEEYARKAQQGSRIGCYYSTDTFLYEQEEVFPLQYLPFEDMMIPVPKNYDRVLRDMYGDYMSFPPEGERFHINFIYADLGDGRKYVMDPIPGSLGAEEQG